MQTSDYGPRARAFQRQLVPKRQSVPELARNLGRARVGPQAVEFAASGGVFGIQHHDWGTGLGPPLVQ